MTNRLELNWKLDGFVDEQRYYCSETPIDPQNLPLPKAVLLNNDRSYIDTMTNAGKRYHIIISSVRDNIEKLSQQLSLYAINRNFFKIKSSFSADFSDEVGVTWSVHGNAKIQNERLILDGSGDYIDTQNSADFNLNHNDDVTIRFIVNPLGVNASSSDLQAVLSKRPSVGGSTGFEITYNAGNMLIANWSASSTSILSNVLRISLDIGQDNEISYERKGGVWYAYKNGNLVITANQTGVFGSNTSNLTIGRSNATSFVPARDFNGSIKNLQLIRGVAVGDGQTTTQKI